MVFEAGILVWQAQFIMTKNSVVERKSFAISILIDKLDRGLGPEKKHFVKYHL